MPSLFGPHEFFQPSRQIYCIITNEDGVVICANNLVQESLKIEVQTCINAQSSNAVKSFLQNIPNPSEILLSHQNSNGAVEMVHWEVHCFTQQPFPYFRWTAAATNSQQQLQKSESFYRTLIADSTNGVLLMNKEGIITFASPSIKNLLDFNPEEVTGKNGFQFVHPDDHAKALESFFLEVQQTPVVKFIVIRLLKKNGEWLWCIVRGHNLLNNPHIANIVVYFHDDTLRKQANDALEESETRFRTLIRDLQVGVLLKDPQGKVIMYNEAAVRMLQESGKKLKETFFWEIFEDVIREDGSYFPAEERPVSQAIKNKKPVKDVVLGVYGKKTKDRIWIIFNADPILDEEGNIVYIVCSVMNITERKKLEKKLIFEQLNRQKLLIQATIDGQERERKEIGKELHDNIGQQLTTIKLYLELANTSTTHNTKEMTRMAIKNITQVINEIRNISRTLVPPTLGDLGLIESINELIDSISRTQALVIQFTYFDFDEETIAENKKLMFFRILQEQLTNVVKHARASMVEIILKNTGEGVLLQITDDGIGFDSNSVRKGLGLTNIKNRAELFGGSVNIQSTSGEGCTLTVCVPHNFRQVV